jgi:hypothetical protein
MALTIKQAQSAKCPAADIQQPVLSPHPIDFECRVAGILYPPGSKPCNGCYSDCTIWKQHKMTMDLRTDQRTAREFQGTRRARHTLSRTDRQEATL